MTEFINDIKKVKEPREHKISNSYGVLDAFYYSKGIHPDITLKAFRRIINAVNKEIAASICRGSDITLPRNMGVFEIRKYEPILRVEEGKLYTTKPIDWQSTLALWEKDSYAKENKLLVRFENKYIYKIRYNKATAEYKNKKLMRMAFGRALRVGIKEAINNNKLDAYLINE